MLGSMLKTYQINAKKHLMQWKVGALFMEAGTGKTRVAIELVNSVNDLDAILWIGPLRTIKSQIENASVVDEINKWGGFKCDNVKYVGVESLSSSDRIYLDSLNFVKCHKKVFIIVDESIKIKNFDAIRTKRVLSIGEHAEYKLILNGTPITKNLLDIWPQMQFLSPNILDMNYTKFKNTFCDYTTVTKTYGYKKYSKEFITGFENVDYLYSLIRHYVYECDLNLNVSQNYHDLFYDLSSDELLAYADIKNDFLTDETMQWKNNNIFLEMTTKMQHCYSCSVGKFQLLDTLFQQINIKKTLIFCRYINSREECEKRYPDAKVLSYQKESLGLNLQDYCNTIYFDKVWDYALRIQSGRRTFRVGQNENCQYWDLNGNVGLEFLITKNINKKISMTEYLKKISLEQLKSDLDERLPGNSK